MLAVENDTTLNAQLKDLKSALNSHEQSAYGNRRSVGTSLIEVTPKSGTERFPTLFYSTVTTDFDDDRNGRF
jgi:hypothetical protein